jgi:hypothetical protein
MIDPPCARRMLHSRLIGIAVSASLILLAAGGCAAAIGVGTVAATDKTPVDHLVSLVIGKDCSVVRKHRGSTYCVEDEATPPVRVHCYPTLGEVTCYAEPDPFPGGQRKLGSEQPAVVTSTR